MAPYNPPYYNDQFARYGLTKVKDLLVYFIDAREGYQIPQRILTLTDKVAKRYEVSSAPGGYAALRAEVDTIIDLSNQSLADNWGYAPVTEAEVRAMARDLKPIIHPKAVLFAEDTQGKPIGFAIAIPDVNLILQRHEWQPVPLRLDQAAVDTAPPDQYRMFALGVIPEYHGKGIDSLIYRALYESLFSARHAHGDQLRAGR